MHPILAGKGRLGLYLATWVPVGGLLALLLTLAGPLSPALALVLALPLALAYAFVCLAAYYLCRAVPLRLTGIPRLLGTQAAAAAVSSSLWLLAGRGWAEALAASGLFPEAPVLFARGGPFLFAVGVLLFLLAAALHYVLAAMEASREAETRALRFQLLSRDAELKALRAQIHPHFLFNSLNSISALTTRDPEGARRMCVLLGDFLRKSLTLGARDRISLAEELELAEALLAIEQVRFGSRLACESGVEEEARSCLLPPLLLQPLVENAVTHGIAPLVEGGAVRIEARRREGRLEIAIENPRDPEAPGRKGAGLGLDNVRKRLEALYGREAGLSVRAEGRRFRAELSLPLRVGP